MRLRCPTGRTAHRVFGILVLALVLAAVVAVSGSSATSTTQTASQAAFRKQFTTYIVQMQQVAKALQATPQGRAGFAELKVDPSADLAKARQAVQRMTPAQLALLQRGYSAYPAWRTIPAKLELLANRMRAASTRRSVMITPNDCAAARAAGYTQTDVEIAADASLTADIILEAIPQDAISSIARVIAVALWAIPQIAQRVIEHSYNIAGACDDDDHQSLTSTNLDVKVSTRATQTSLDSLTTNFNTLSTLINNRLDVAVSTRASQTSLTAFNTEFTNNATAVNTKLDNLQTSVNTVQTSINTANTKLDTALTKLDTVLTELDQNAATDLRLKIEDNLGKPFGEAMVAFMLPEPNGYLGLARDIVADSLQKIQAAGLPVANAQSLFSQGETNRANGSYKKAYQFYSNAYRAAANA